MILEARDVTFYYRGRRHTPGAGELQHICLLGRTGGTEGTKREGKTTLCRLAQGYEKPAKGQVLLDGRPVREYRGVCPVQMVWQHPETVVDPLLTLGKTLNEAGAVEQRLLDALHIEPGWLTRYPSELSGGELQRFCLARALNLEVRFLLCDEISAMLDLVTQAQIWKFLLEEAQRRGLGMLVVSHDEALLEKVCTRVETMPWQI